MENINFIQTLSFNQSKNPYIDSFGWAAPEYHLISWALSSLQLKKIYGKVDLYCNNEAAKLLIEELGLPYHQVHLSHNQLMMPDEKLWALPKIFTYSLQTKPFIHIDGDVFLFCKLPASLLAGDLICQNIEEATDYYFQTQIELMNNFSYFPSCVAADFKSDLPIKAVNAGILGGYNIDFIQEYVGLAFNYINNNISHLKSINVDRFNVFFEQHLFYSLAKEKGINIEALINGTIKDNQYLYLGNFHETPCNRNYLHLLGHYKKDEYTCRLMASKLRELYPAYYYKIITLFSNKTGSNCSFIQFEEKFGSLNSYLRFSEESKVAFNSNATNATINNIVANKVNPQTLNFLQLLVNDIDANELYTKKQIEDDFEEFSKSLLSVLNNNERPTDKYIYGRDLDSPGWHCEIFATKAEVMDKLITKCDEINIITSQFDWAGLYNKHTRIAVKYYGELELAPGEFYTLVIPEIYGDGFSIQDIDEMENIILANLQTPVSIAALFALMFEYVEEEIIQNHLDEYKTLFLVMLKQLILKKAIKPVKNARTSIV